MMGNGRLALSMWICRESLSVPSRLQDWEFGSLPNSKYMEQEESQPSFNQVKVLYPEVVGRRRD